jgi:hypothetical protein
MFGYGDKVSVDFNDANGALHPGIITRDLGRLIGRRAQTLYVVRFIRNGLMYERPVMYLQLSPRGPSKHDTRLRRMEYRYTNPRYEYPARFTASRRKRA